MKENICCLGKRVIAYLGLALVIFVAVTIIASERTNASTDISKAEVYLSEYEYIYDGTYKYPDVNVYLGDEELSSYDYSVDYYNNINVGTATVVVTGDYDYSGEVRKTFTIKKCKLDKRNFWLYNSDFVYNGKTKKISVRRYVPSRETTITLKKGRDVTIKSKKLRKVGKYTVTVKGKGNYTGRIKFKVYIRPKNPKGVKLTKRYKRSYGIKWKRVKGATGYVVEYLNKKGTKYVKKNLGKKRTFKVRVGEDYTATVWVYSYKKVKGKKILSRGRYYRNGIRPKGKPKFKVSSGYGNFSVKMKRKGYYEMWVATNKSFTKNFKPFTFYGGYGFDDIRINCWGEHYRYIKIRQYVEKPDGTKMYGKWSKRRKVIFY